MALFTARAKRAIVLIILVVATNTAGSEPHSSANWRFVAFRTPDIPVLALQREAGLIMVKIPAFPVARVMARLAGRFKSPLMDILFFVARQAD